MLQDRLPLKFQDVKFKDPKFKQEIFMRIDMKHFSVVEIIIELLLFANNLFIVMHNLLSLYKF